MWIYVKLLFTAVFWGGTFIAGRILAAEVAPFSASFLRFAVATVCLAVITWRIEERFPRVHGRQMVAVTIQARGVDEAAVLRAMERVPRHRFV